MDGYTLTRQLQELLGEPVGSSWLNTRVSYDYLYQAACAINVRIGFLTSSTTLTTVAGTASYNLPPDFHTLYLLDDNNEPFVKYSNGTTDTMLPFKDRGAMVHGNDTTAVALPDNFTIEDSTPAANLTGDTSAAGAAVNGECTLTDAQANFASVNVGDAVHNTTDGSHGIVVVVTSATALVTALLDGTANDWTSDDDYVIVPQTRYKLVLNPPPSTSGHTVTVQYIKHPDPVYSLYRSYPFPTAHTGLLVKYAAWLCKYRDGQPNYGDEFYKRFDDECRRLGRETSRSLNRGTGIRVNMVKRGNRSGTYR